MTCVACDDVGIVPFVAADNPKPDADIDADDLLFAICLCDAGARLRRERNDHQKVAPLWRVWCAREGVDPSRVCLIESVYDTDTLRTAGLSVLRPMPDRRAALLAEGSRESKKPRL